MTEPSGQGDYAEAMRELIAELRLGPRGLAADNVLGARPPSVRGGHLYLVR